jgi:hypothetical protein
VYGDRIVERTKHALLPFGYARVRPIDFDAKSLIFNTARLPKYPSTGG